MAAAAIAAATTWMVAPTEADEPSQSDRTAAAATPQTFLGTYCTECHGAKTQKGERRFDQLSLPVRDADALLELQDILEQLNLGEMPPKKAKQPCESSVAHQIEACQPSADQSLVAALRARLAAG